MPRDIRAYGTEGVTRVTITLGTMDDPTGEPYTVPRAVWFDRDAVSGTWLVWVRDPDEYGPTDDDVGAIAVRDPAVSAFLEQLGRLLLEPREFFDEPVFDGS